MLARTGQNCPCQGPHQLQTPLLWSFFQAPKTSPGLWPGAASGNHSQDPSHSPPPRAIPASCLLFLPLACLPDSQVSEDFLGSSFSSAGDSQDTAPCYLPCGFWGCAGKMSWRQVILLSSLSALALLCSEYGRGQRVGRVSYTVRLCMGKFVQVGGVCVVR